MPGRLYRIAYDTMREEYKGFVVNVKQDRNGDWTSVVIRSDDVLFTSAPGSSFRVVRAAERYIDEELT